MIIAMISSTVNPNIETPEQRENPCLASRSADTSDSSTQIQAVILTTLPVMTLR